METKYIGTESISLPPPPLTINCQLPTDETDTPPNQSQPKHQLPLNAMWYRQKCEWQWNIATNNDKGTSSF